MTYDQLVTLDSIVKTGSFKAASDFLHKSQPSLSVAIKKLEEEFQIQIFDRSGYRPELTPEGKLFYEKAKMALVHMKSLELFGEELGMGVEQEIIVGIDGLAPLTKILCELRNFFDEYPTTNLTLSMEQLSGTIEKLLNDEIELGFTPLHDPHPEIETIPFYKTKMIPVCVPQLKTDTESLKNIPQVIVTDSGTKTEGKNFGVMEDARKWHVTNMDAKKQILIHGMGWGRLPDFLIAEELKNKTLKEIKNPDVEIHEVSIYMAHHRGRAMGPITKKLWNRLKSYLS